MKNVLKIFEKSVDKTIIMSYTVIEHLNNASIIGGRVMNETEKNHDKYAFIIEKMPDEDTVYSLAELFKALGEPTRAKILSALRIRDLCVGEIAEILGMTASAVSHQLRVLRGIKLVKGVKDGKEVKYSLDDEHVTIIMECGLTHVKHAVSK